MTGVQFKIAFHMDEVRHYQGSGHDNLTERTYENFLITLGDNLTQIICLSYSIFYLRKRSQVVNPAFL